MRVRVRRVLANRPRPIVACQRVDAHKRARGQREIDQGHELNLPPAPFLGASSHDKITVEEWTSCVIIAGDRQCELTFPIKPS